MTTELFNVFMTGFMVGFLLCIIALVFGAANNRSSKCEHYDCSDSFKWGKKKAYEEAAHDAMSRWPDMAGDEKLQQRIANRILARVEEECK